MLLPPELFFVNVRAVWRFQLVAQKETRLSPFDSTRRSKLIHYTTRQRIPAHPTGACLHRPEKTRVKIPFPIRRLGDDECLDASKANTEPILVFSQQHSQTERKENPSPICPLSLFLCFGAKPESAGRCRGTLDD